MKEELWEQLDNETNPAYSAFQHYYMLPRRDRSIIAAYRSFSGNEGAKTPNKNFINWYHEHAWAERARARDTHLDRIHMHGVTAAIEEVAKEEARQSLEFRGRMSELLTGAYLKAMEWLENQPATDLRPQDVVTIIKLHIEASDKFRSDASEGAAAGDDWNEENEREVDEIMAELDAERAQARVKEVNSGDEEGDSPADAPEGAGG